MADKYSYALNRSDTFEGEYATREEAAAAAFADYDASPDEWNRSSAREDVTSLCPAGASLGFYYSAPSGGNERNDS